MKIKKKQRKKNSPLIFLCVYEFKIGVLKETCEQCRKDKSHSKKAVNRNCGYIDPSLWKGKEKPLRDMSLYYTECPNSIFGRNDMIIHILLMLSQENNPTNTLTYLENRAIIDFKVASNICDNILREEAERNRPKPGHTKL